MRSCSTVGSLATAVMPVAADGRSTCISTPVNYTALDFPALRERIVDNLLE